jgi:tetratricopeptide (TPR) repeat protein
VTESRRTRRGEDEDDEDARNQWTDSEESDDQESDDDGAAPNRQMARTSRRRSPARHRVVSGEVFDVRRAIPIGLLRLARNWSEAGSVYQAIHAYTEVLVRYPETGAADAAVEELLVLAEKLAQQGRYYAALGIFNKLEALC